MRPALFATTNPGLVLLAGALAVSALGGCDPAMAWGPEQTQPMEFNHVAHAERDIDCTACHERAGDYPLAGLPQTRACMKCHKEPEGDDPEEPKVREYAERGEEIPWVRVNWMEGHVYFSHAMHVTLAEMECQQCHIGIEKAERALTRPNVHLTMGDCMACHEKERVSNDCAVCHK